MIDGGHVHEHVLPIFENITGTNYVCWAVVIVFDDKLLCS